MSFTVAIIKPDVVDKALGVIIAKIQDAGFHIVSMKTMKLSESQAAEFYEEHSGKEFYPYLVEFMAGATCVALILYKNNAVEDFRELIGSTNPAKAKNTSIRGIWGDKSGTALHRNAIHGSDSDKSARREMRILFPESS